MQLAQSLLSPRRVPRPPRRDRSRTASLRCHGVGSGGRRHVEQFIQSVYAEHYGARIAAWAPYLVSFESGGAIVAAAGYRGAWTALYLERYLVQPIEHAIAAAAGVDVARGEIAEVGHLASVRAGASRALIFALGQHLVARGFRWAASTATQELRTILTRLGIRAVELGAADPRRLGAAAADWGRYYAHAPAVIAIDLAAHVPAARSR